MNKPVNIYAQGNGQGQGGAGAFNTASIAFYAGQNRSTYAYFLGLGLTDEEIRKGMTKGCFEVYREKEYG